MPTKTPARRLLMTDRNELSTADLASHEPDDAATHHAPDPDTDPRDTGTRDTGTRDTGTRDADRDPLPREVTADDAGAGRDRDDESELVREPDPGHHAPETTGTAGPLLAARDAEGFRARWNDVQTAFVDSPRQSVEQADALVAEVMQHLATTFAAERSELERQWDRGDDIPTDDLRTAFQRYRSFFERLLAT
jgi:hypothetical protein